jgi:hypothetical protein
MIYILKYLIEFPIEDTSNILLCTCVEGPCLHRPENWLVRQLNDESKVVYEVGFISEKGKATMEPGSQWLAAQVKAGVFMDVLTLG